MSALALARMASLSRSSSGGGASPSQTFSIGGTGPLCWSNRDSGARHVFPAGLLPSPTGTPGAVEADCGRIFVAVGQMTSNADKDRNFKVCSDLAHQAAKAGCSALFLPECFSFLGNNSKESVAAAEPLSGPTLARYMQLAKETNIWLSLGGFQQRSEEDPTKLLNTHVMVNSEGSVAATYSKVHLFDVDVPNGPLLMESSFTVPGDRLVACDSPFGRVGLTICYDLRFPELYQRLTHDHGATILTVPSAFTKPTGEAHWEVLLRARAIETQSYVIAAAQAGRHNERRESYGHSLIVDPWGTVVARLKDPLATGIAVAEIDSKKVEQVRSRMPIVEHRRAGMEALARTDPPVTSPELRPNPCQS